MLALPLASVSGSTRTLSRYEEVVLVQSLPSGHQCAFGNFILLESQPTHFVFKSLSGRKPSQLESWARLTSSALLWQIIKPTSESSSRPYLQNCERWLHTGEALTEVKMVSARRELFLSSKEFSRVLPLHTGTSVFIEPDFIRGGWRISSLQGGWQGLLVYGAQSGLKQKLSVRFPLGQAEKSSVRQRHTQRALSKPIALPGWD
ncbi:MAG: hypothetical protein RI932_2028 [Pseudomonadota bacterium]